ncbi:hypothetical protein [Streptomyces sp. NPDC052107]|uniref:WD40/YVTN/BNR-like repeat-containing protein n=1 Tax=Streptomyces sp. NPDC052107 TaxID=3155632 RepID=UPI00342B2B25
MNSRSLLQVVLAASVSTVLVAATASSAAAAQPVGTAPRATTAGHWQSMGPDSSGGYLAFTRAAPSRLYVLPDAGYSVFRSDDHGLTWRQPGWLGMPGAVGVRVAADPGNPDVVWVTANASGGDHGYVLRSDDGAETFHPVLDTQTALADIVVSPSGRQLFAAGAAGVYASVDGGVKWRLLPGSPGAARRLAFSGGNLVVGTGDGLYLIEDALRNPRTARKLPLPGSIFTTHLSAHGGLVVASPLRDGSAVVSQDYGRTWRTLTGPWGTDTVVFSAVAAGEIHVQTLQASADGPMARKNVWLSSDQGQTWTARPEATPAVDLYSDLGSFPDRPHQEVVTGTAGVFTTRDSTHFQRIGVPATAVDALAQSGPVLVAGTGTGSYSSASPLSRHLPAGYQDWGWTGHSPDTLGNTIGALAAVPNGMLRVRDAYCPDSCIALEQSSDRGAHWQTLTFADGESRSLAVDPRHPSRLYIGASVMFTGVYSSTDGGSTLQPHYLPGLSGVRSVAVDPRTDGSLWIGDFTGLYRSRDGGATVTKVFAGDVERVAVDPKDPAHVVAVGDHLIKVSHDGGTSFDDAFGQPSATYSDVTFAPDGTVFAVSGDAADGPGRGVVRSTDGGARWADISAGLPDRDVRSVLVSADGQWLFAGTGRSGVYRLAVGSRSLRP